MSDDDDTWRKRRPVIWDDDKRANESASRRRTRDGSPGNGIPLPPPVRSIDEITQPIELLERDLSQSEIEVIRRSKRDSKDPVYYEDLVKVVEALTKEKSESRERDAAYNAVIQSPHEIANAMAKRIKTIKWVIAIATLLTGTGTGLTASGVLSSQRPANTVDQLRVEQLLRDIGRIDAELREVRIILGRRSAIDISPSSFPVSTKGLPR